jgi:hypothetical protein
MVTNTILAQQLFMTRNLEWEGVVPKAGLYKRGLLKSLMDWAILPPTADFPLQAVCRSLFLFLGFCRHLLVRLTPI